MSLKLKYLPHILLALLALLLAWPSFAVGVPNNPLCAMNDTCPAGVAEAAAADTYTDGQVAKSISYDLVCDTMDLISGPLGLMAGFILAAYGLYVWIRQDSFKIAMVYIICGALLTAVPGLVFSTFTGLGTLIIQSGIATTSPKFPTCTRVGGGF